MPISAISSATGAYPWWHVRHGSIQSLICIVCAPARAGRRRAVLRLRRTSPAENSDSRFGCQDGPGRPESQREVNNPPENAAIIFYEKAKQILLVNRLFQKPLSLQFCNKLPQNGRNSFKPAHLLLPVRNCSALINLRRRGASRSRPVLVVRLSPPTLRGAVDFLVVFDGTFIAFVHVWYGQQLGGLK